MIFNAKLQRLCIITRLNKVSSNFSFGVLNDAHPRNPTADRVLRVIQACLVLHNIATKCRDHIEPQPENDDTADPDPDNLNSNQPQQSQNIQLAQGKAKRNQIVQQFFSY